LTHINQYLFDLFKSGTAIFWAAKIRSVFYTYSVIQILRQNQGKRILFLAPIAVKILLCRTSAQKIGTDSGKSSKKISDSNPLAFKEIENNYNRNPIPSTHKHPKPPCLMCCFYLILQHEPRRDKTLF